MDWEMFARQRECGQLAEHEIVPCVNARGWALQSSITPKPVPRSEGSRPRITVCPELLRIGVDSMTGDATRGLRPLTRAVIWWNCWSVIPTHATVPTIARLQKQKTGKPRALRATAPAERDRIVA